MNEFSVPKGDQPVTVGGCVGFVGDHDHRLADVIDGTTSRLMTADPPANTISR